MADFTPSSSANCGGDGGDEGEFGEIDQKLKAPCPIELALANPLILHKIVKHLDVASAEVCRLVSSRWESVVVTATPPIFTLNQFKICDEDEEERNLFTRNLCRKVKVTNDASWTNFANFCEMFGGLVEDLDFHGNFELLPTLIRHLDKLPNLVKLRIQCMEGELPIDFTEVPKKILPKLKLEDIQILPVQPGLQDMGLEARLILKSMSPVVQVLVNAAPKLKGLSLENCYYPDLSRCGSLQSLTWIGNPLQKGIVEVIDDPIQRLMRCRVGYVKSQDFDWKRLSIMLKQVARGLQELKLGVNMALAQSLNAIWNHPDICKFKVPPMPQLRIFKNGCLPLFPIRDFGIFRNLEIFRLCQNWIRDDGHEVERTIVEDFLIHLSIRHQILSKIKKLEIDSVRGPATQVFDLVDQMFPNLQEFNFRFRGGRDNGTVLREAVLALTRMKIPSVTMILPNQPAFNALACIVGFGPDDPEVPSTNASRRCGGRSLKRLRIKVAPDVDRYELVYPCDWDWVRAQEPEGVHELPGQFAMILKNLDLFVVQNTTCGTIKTKMQNFGADNNVVVIFC